MLKHKNIHVLFWFLLLSLFVFFVVTEVKWWMFGLVIFVWLSITIWGAFDIRSNYFVRTYCQGKTTKKEIALTFDDGPTPVTENILNILQQNNVKATFFCIGKQIEKHPDIFKRIILEGHLVGNHSYSHDRRMGFFSTRTVVEDIKKNDEVIQTFSGKKALFFRPPFGVTNPKIASAIVQTGHHVIGWNNRSLDAVITDESLILKRVTNKISPGGIILFHDTSIKTFNVLEQLLLSLHNKNYRVTPLDELLNLKAYED